MSPISGLNATFASAMARPIYCAKRGYVDEIVSFPQIRKYLEAFAGCAYQNPVSICPHHHMMIPRIIKG